MGLRGLRCHARFWRPRLHNAVLGHLRAAATQDHGADRHGLHEDVERHRAADDWLDHDSHRHARGQEGKRDDRQQGCAEAADLRPVSRDPANNTGYGYATRAPVGYSFGNA